MNKRPDFETFKKLAMQNEAFRAEYERLGPEFELIAQRIEAEKEARLKKKADATASINHSSVNILGQ